MKRGVAGGLIGCLLGLGACGGEATPPDRSTAEPPETAPVAASPAPVTASPAPGAASPAKAPAAAERTGGWFQDRTAASGLAFVHEAGQRPEKHLPETMGAGGVLFDLDADGDLDIYLVQGGPMRDGAGPGRFADPPGPLPTNRLYLNDGGGRFEDITPRSGAAADTGYGMGAVSADFDGDGHADLFVTNLGPDVLLLGDGRGAFAQATGNGGIDDPRWTAGAVAFDAEGDGDVDLFVTGYLEVDLDQPIWCGDRKPGWRSVCHPDAYPGLTDRFWRNRGDGTFEDATLAAGFQDSAGKGLGAVAFDVENDGDLDLYVANDSVENRLWLNRGDGRFEDGTILSGTGVNGRGATEAGMGLAVGDVDGDLRADLFVTNFDNESNTLYVGQPGGLFRDRTAPAGLEAASRLPVGFGTALADFDHDGDLDLVVTNGHIIDNIHLYHDGKAHRQVAQGFRNDGSGRFDELSATELGDLAAAPIVGRGLYPGDLDGDGDLDLLVTECGGPARLFENTAPLRSGLILPDLPAGARVVATTEAGTELLRFALAPVSYFGQGSPGVHLGVPAGQLRSIRVEPPYGGEPFELDPAALDGR